MATTIYILSGYSTTSPASSACPGYYDTLGLYEFTVYDGYGNIINAPININIAITGSTSYYGGGGVYVGGCAISSGTTGNTESIYVDEAVDGSPGCPCPCTTTITIDYVGITTSDPGYNLILVDAVPYTLNVYSGLTNDDACSEIYPATVYSYYSSLTDTLAYSGILYQDIELSVVVDPSDIFADGTGYCFLLDGTSAVVDNPICTVGPATPTPTPTITQTPTLTPFPSGCYQYSATGLGCTVSYYDCDGNYVSVSSIEFYDFCADTTYGPITSDCDSIVTVGPCPSSTPTPTPTETPTMTPSETPTQTPTLSPGATPYPTTTPTPTNTETPTQTPSVSPSNTPTMTPTNTQTPTETPTMTQTNTQTKTPTMTPTPTTTNTLGPSPTPTQTSTMTPTPSVTEGFSVQFVDCTNSSNIFRFNDPTIPGTVGVTYLITGSTEYEGCATVVLNDNTGPIYDGTGVIFQTVVGCGDELCPRSSTKSALLTRCSDSVVFYANVEEDTAFIGATYVYNGSCYAFVEFSGPGGPDLGSPAYSNCAACTPTSTPNPTPSITPTISATPSACTSSDFCFYTQLSSLSQYNGNYSAAGFYSGRVYYSGDGLTSAFIYNTGNEWCLSTSLGGSCILQGATPCYSSCPDISLNDFNAGPCPTPNPTPTNCNGFNFNAYFDCDWEPIPTPTPSIACDDVNFDIYSFGVTPTPSPTGDICNGKGLSFSLSGYTPVTPTVTLTPSVTLTRTVDVQGAVTYTLLDETFVCASSKVLSDCITGELYYTNSQLIFSGIPVTTGLTMYALVNESQKCVTYIGDNDNISSNSTVDAIYQIYGEASECNLAPTPTPTVTPSNTATETPTQTPTQTATPENTPTNTASQTPTPTPTATYGSTPTQTPSNTATPTSTTTPTPSNTATNTPTPSFTSTPTPTPNWVYVYETCDRTPYGHYYSATQVIQTVPNGIVSTVGEAFKDSSNNCWYYFGRFETDYIPAVGITPITFEGNYFNGSPTTSYANCDICATPTATVQTVMSVGGFMQPCVGGTIDDFMGASVGLDSPVEVDTTITVNVYYQYGYSYIPCNNNLPYNNSTSFSVFIPAGQAYGQADPCYQGQYFSTGANVCGACVAGSDNPNINFGQFSC